jgi:formylglycine-generating enzyme required for sulfatase activity
MAALIRLAALCAVLVAFPALAQQPAATRDCPTCPELLKVAPGSFVMGSSAEEEEREQIPPASRGAATPQHRVTIAYSFWMGRAPVTRDQYGAFVTATKRDVGPSCWGVGRDNKWQEFKGGSWAEPGFDQAGDHPALCVSHDDAQAYVEWLSSTTGKRYRLPSEAEWEYVARAGTSTARFWGDGRDEACRFANVADDTFWQEMKVPNTPGRYFACHDGYLFTSPVDAFAANPWGFHDMLGNVWERLSDCWHPTYEGAPVDGSTWAETGGGDCKQRIGRGGSRNSYPWTIRAANRDRDDAGNRHTSSGFRVVRAE